MGILREEWIGGQRLILGNCLEVMPGLGAVGHVIGDPPYEDALHSAFGKIRRRDGVAMPTSLGFAGINAIRSDVARQAIEVASGWVILFTLAEGVMAWRDEIQRHGGKYDTCIAWVKPDSTPRMNGQGPARGFECAVTAWAGTGHRRWNAGGKRGIYTHTVNPPDRDGRHPTEKPWRLMAELLRDFTRQDETILDPFMGSGSTLVACQRMGRAGIGIEMDPQHFETACQRVDEAARQPDFFTAPPAKLVQEGFL